MDVPGQSVPEPLPENNTPERVHNAEQNWARAQDHLAKILEYGDSMRESMATHAGGNSDISVVYDWWKAYIQLAEEQGAEVARRFGIERNGAHDMTIMMCAAALTTLMREDDRREADDVLAQLQKEWDKDK